MGMKATTDGTISLMSGERPELYVHGNGRPADASAPDFGRGPGG